jgi:hypothetical protein
MIEVSEMLKQQTTEISLDQAIRHYYALIQQERYEESFPMLSSQFKNALSVTTLTRYRDEWESSGAAILLALEPEELEAKRAVYVLDLHYPAGPVTHKIRYVFARDVERGHPRFGYWLFMRGTFV